MSETEDIPESRKNPLKELTKDWEAYVAYLHGAPHRTGESFRLPLGQRVMVGRGPGEASDGARATPGRKLAGRVGRSHELDIETPTIAKRELAFTAYGEHVELEALCAKHRVRANGAPVTAPTRIEEDGIVAVEGEMVLHIVKRSRDIPAFAHFDPKLMGPFGRENDLDLVGQSEVFCALMDALVVAVAAKMPILITGASGVGKQLIARALHKLSPYADGPFIVENATKPSAGVAAKQFFGNRAGWPSHGDGADPGMFGRARGGALLLDEFGDMQEPMRGMLLTALQDKKYRTADGFDEFELGCLVLAATNVPLAEIRHDLRRRFHVLDVASLAARREDIPHLALHIIREARTQEDRRAKEVRNLPWVLEYLLMHPLPGNMRELKEILLNGLLDLRSLEKDALPAAPRRKGNNGASDDALEMTVRGLLHKYKNNQAKVEREMGWTRSTMRAFMKRRGIKTS